MKHETFMKMAIAVSEESTCISKQVGAIIVVDDRPVTTGYNGTHSERCHCSSVAIDNGFGELVDDKVTLTDRAAHSKWSQYHEVHAEINAIAHAARSGLSIDNGSLYVTLSPCHDCAKALIASGIKEVYYLEEYDRSPAGWQHVFLSNGIHLEQIEFGEK